MRCSNKTIVLLPAKKTRILYVVCVSLCFFSSFMVSAADRYWVAAAPSNWSNSSNWSTTSGGAGGASVPAVSDRAIFNGAGTSNVDCTIDAAISISGLNITPGYSASITQGANPIVLGISGAVLSAGNFYGGSAPITVNGPFTINGVNFTSTSNTLQVAAGYNFLFSSGIFQHNNGTVQLNTNNNAITGSLDFYNLTFFNGLGPSVHTITSGSILKVNSNLTLAGNASTSLDAGIVEVLGDVIVTNSAGDGGGSATINILGTATQTITTLGVANPTKLPKVIINKPSGQLNLAGDIYVGNNWTYISGTVNAGTSRVVFSQTLTITGSLAFNEIEFKATNGDYVITIASGTQLSISGNLYISGTKGVFLQTGRLLVTGNITVTNTSPYTGGSAEIVVNSVSDQVLTGSGVALLGRLPKITIDKASGTLHLVDVITVSDNWTYLQGTLDAGTSRLVFSKDVTITGTHTLNDVEFASTTFEGGSYIIVASGTTLTINGSTVISGTQPVGLGTGFIDTKGDVTITNTSQWTGGTATIRINGSGNQTLTGSGLRNMGCLPKVQIIKTAGILNLVGIISAANDWTYTSGTLVPGTSRVVFSNWLRVTGSHVLNDIEVSSLVGAFGLIVTTGDVLTASGKLYLARSNTMSIYDGTLEARGDIEISNSATGGGGSGTLRISGPATQTLTSVIAAGQGALPNIIIDKISGQLNLSGITTVAGYFTYSNGAVDAGTSTVNFLNATGIDGEGSSSTMPFYNVMLGDNNLHTLTGNLLISNALALASGKINLNGKTCSLTQSSPAAITRTSGYIVSESTNNSGKISWTMGSTTGAYIYPFASSGGTAYIPVIFELTAGNPGVVTVSTYPVAVNNTPYPVTPAVVTNLVWGGNANFSSYAVDRFWHIDKTGSDGTANVTYTYASGEVSGNVTGNQLGLRAQRYDGATNTWQNPGGPQSANAAAYNVTENGVTLFSTSVLSTYNTVLPVKLLSFTATASENKTVALKWATASETGSDNFYIERSADGRTFEHIGTVKAAGNSQSIKNYSFADMHPLAAVSYYRVKQIDIDATFSYSNIVTVQIRNAFSIDVNYSINGSIIVKFSTPVPNDKLSIFDQQGRVMYIKQVNGVNQFVIPVAGWPQGVYILNVGDTNKRFTIF